VKTIVETVDQTFVENLKECAEMFDKGKIDIYDDP
jgi:hypothetical protein